eukprot:scpid95046/ scgid8584/ 
MPSPSVGPRRDELHHLVNESRPLQTKQQLKQKIPTLKLPVRNVRLETPIESICSAFRPASDRLKPFCVSTPTITHCPNHVALLPRVDFLLQNSLSSAGSVSRMATW